MPEILSQYRMFAADDVDGAYDQLHDSFRLHQIELVGPTDGLDLRFNSVVLGDLRFVYARYGAAVRVRSDFPDQHAVVLPTTGSLSGALGQRQAVLDVRRGGMLNPDEARDLTWSADAETLAVYFPARLTAELASGLDPSDGREPPPVHFHQVLDRGAPAVRTWHRLLDVVQDELDRGSPLLRSPLARAGLEQSLVAGLLAAQPNSSQVDLARDSRVSPSLTVRRALDLISAHPDRPWRIDDLARGAGVSARTLQAAFRRELGTTPLQELRRQRIDRAHRDLVDGDQVSTSVTEIAGRWGFFHLGRFAAAYRRAHGATPQETLRD